MRASLVCWIKNNTARTFWVGTGVCVYEFRAAGLLFAVFLLTFSCPTQAVSIHSHAESRGEVYTFKATHLPPTNLPSSTTLGTARNPAGERLGMTNFYFTRNGKPWLPFMAEFHYARTPSQDWELELAKIKANGVRIVSTYCFWIHHEESQGEWDWKDQRNLRRFVELCAKQGLLVYLRIGPYCHGEVRNGGLPDWVLRKSKPHTSDPAFLEFVRQWYAQLGLQVKGLLFSQGGPIIGIQLDNEYRHEGDYLQRLKQLAVQEGLDVPYYSATGWEGAQVPIKSMLSVWGSYPGAPWSPGTDELGPKKDYLFTGVLGNARLDSADRVELKQRGFWLPRDIPFTLVEVGGGNQVTLHRRPVFQQADIDALMITMLGRGANLLGVYMFHGGSNPTGRSTALHEPGLPKISYDFQAPLSEFGQPRPWYHSLRNLASFLNDFGSLLAPGFPFLPNRATEDPKNITLLRCALRVSPQSAFLFFHNHQRGVETRDLGPLKFDIALPTRKLLLPSTSTVIPKNALGIWPLNLNLGGVRMAWATAQPLYLLETKDSLYCFLKEIPGIAPEIALDPQTISSAGGSSEASIQKIRNSKFLLTKPKPGMNVALNTVSTSGCHVRFVVLSTEQAEKSWKAKAWGRDRIFISNADFLIFSDKEVRAFRTGVPHVSLAIFPAEGTGLTYEAHPKGIFRNSLLQTDPISIPMDIRALTPERWSLSPALGSLGRSADALLRITYIGNIATLSVRGKIVADNFYNGTIWEVSLHRFFPEHLELSITPLKRSTRVCLPQWPEILETQVLDLKHIEAVPQYEFQFH